MRRLSTSLIHGHDYRDERLGVFIPPIYLTAIYEQIGEARRSDRGKDLKYSREENVTVRAFERILSKIELGDDALAFSSGMAAISTTLLCLLDSSRRVIIPLESYGATIQLVDDLRKFNVSVVKVWPSTEAIADAIKGDKDVVFVETMTNPMLRVIDVREVAKACRERGATLIVDNTFVTPVLYNPLPDGADVVVHSVTKYISGHNDVVGGAVISRREIIDQLWDWRRKLGTIMSPFDAYMCIRGVKTLEVRFERQSRSALEIAEFLHDHPKVEEVHYPGLKDSPYHDVACRLFKRRMFGAVVSFKIKGGINEVEKLMRSLRIIRPTPSLGGVESLLTYPITSAARGIPVDSLKELGITESLLRLSVGLEDVEDLKEDLDRALQTI